MATAKQGRKKPADRQIPGRKKRRSNRFHVAVGLFVAIVVVSGALAILLLVRPGATGVASDKPAVFGIHQIVVSGETRYAHDDIIAASGISVGQSIFSVKKVKAHDTIMAKFPYLERVEVGNSSFDTVEIHVWEVEAVGAMYANGSWLVVGSNNKGVESLPLQGDKPPRYLYFKGATPADGKVGGKAMDDRSFAIATAMLQSIKTHELENVGEIDLSQKTNIRMNWNNQLTVMLGTENNLEEKVAGFVNFLPNLLKNNGGKVSGQLDMRSYMEDNRAIYTPSDILTSKTPTSPPSAAGKT